MEITTPNLFRALFDWRPREAMRPAENFLTEGFVYILQTVPTARRLWLKDVLGIECDDSSLTINTRTSHNDLDRGSTIYPDIEITGHLTSGERFCCFVENKWWAAFDQGQIDKYENTLRHLAWPEKRYLVFISASYRDCCNARKPAPASDPVIHRSVFMWEDIYRLLQEVTEPSQALMEFLEFMTSHGLNPSPALSAEVIDAYIRSRSVPDILSRWCEKLQKEFDWSCLPTEYSPLERSAINTQYGRTGLLFLQRPGSWNGLITVGFLQDNWDHMIPFSDGSNSGLDLIIRIEADPKLTPQLVHAQLGLNRAALDLKQQGYVARTKGDPQNRNRHTLLIVQRSLRDVLAGCKDEASQLEAIHAQAISWLQIIFRDPQLAVELASLPR